MNGMHRLISKRVAIIIFNILGVVFLCIDGKMKADLESIVAVAVAFIIMNFVVWRSTKDYPDWK